MTTPLSSVPDRVLSPTRSAAAEARRARREQLRDFYGLKNGSSPNSPAGGTPLASPDLASGSTSPFGPGLSVNTKGRKDLSSPAFVPSEYYEDLISRASLADLLQTTSVLATDVGRLQSARHTLVYNHHHQLFSAGDTIAQLNTRTPQLLSIVTSLQERFSDMSQLADSVALPDIPESGSAAVSRAQVGVERVRLMILAEESRDKVIEKWNETESAITASMNAPPEGELASLLSEGRKLATKG